MRLLGDHLKHETITGSQKANNHSKRSQEEKAYSSNEFFTNDYRLPNRHPGTLFYDDDRILGLQHLVLGYFNIATDLPAPQAGSEDSLNEDEAVDLQRKYIFMKPRKLFKSGLAGI